MSSASADGSRTPVLSAFGSARTPQAAADLARRTGDAGFGGLWIPEGAQPVFSVCAGASMGLTGGRLGTSVALAFPRSPMLSAQAAWMLAEATGGNFVLGLGTQVRAHIERRFSAQFSSPGPRMREYVQSIRAIYQAFRGEARLKFEGDFYNFSLLSSQWSPGPMEFVDPPIYVAGVRPWMCGMAGEVADGVLVHPLSTPDYLADVLLPAVAQGEARASRAAGTVKLVCPIMTAVSDSEAVRLKQRNSIRYRLAFYGSTPGYGIVFDVSGWPGVGDQLNALQREGKIDEMAALITDEMLDAFSITSTWEELPTRLHDRFAGIAEDIVCYSALEHWGDDADAPDRWMDVNRRFQALAAAG